MVESRVVPGPEHHKITSRFVLEVLREVSVKNAARNIKDGCSNAVNDFNEYLARKEEHKRQIANDFQRLKKQVLAKPK